MQVLFWKSEQEIKVFILNYFMLAWGTVTG